MSDRVARSPAIAASVLAVSVAALAIAVPALGSGPTAGGPSEQMPGGERGSDKQVMIDRFQSEYEAALRGTMAPPAGRPDEGWQPILREGIDNEAESPFEGTAFVLSNMWQAMRPDGRLVQVFAGVQQGRSKLIFIELDVMTGVNEVVLEVPLPDGSGVPRLSGVEGTTLALSTSTGAAFRFDVVRRILSASN